MERLNGWASTGLIKGMRIDPDKVSGTRIFRTWGWPVLVVSEDLKEAMERYPR